MRATWVIYGILMLWGWCWLTVFHRRDGDSWRFAAGFSAILVVFMAAVATLLLRLTAQ